jgi:hypothetical protein
VQAHVRGMFMPGRVVTTSSPPLCVPFLPRLILSRQLLSFASAYQPNPMPLCVAGYTIASGRVGCRQAGYDSGRASITSYQCVLMHLCCCLLLHVTRDRVTRC